jgi:membrane fusion protein (multidrug efflux system)
MTSTPFPVFSAARTRRRAAAGLAGVAFLIIAGCGKEKAATPPPPIVEVVTVTQQDVPIYMEWIGSLDGNVNAVIRPQVTGYLVKQNYREGDLVKKGQPLFEIDPRTFEAAVDEAKGPARPAGGALRNDEGQPGPHQAAGGEERGQSEGSRRRHRCRPLGEGCARAADASLKTARLNLGFTKITSPVTGIAGIAKAQIGDLLSPSMPTELTTVSTVEPIKVYFNISEREYLKVATAAIASGSQPEKVPLTLILVDGSVYPQPGRFSILNRQVDTSTGTFKAAALFNNPDNLLRPGQYGKVRATMSVQKGALLVPQRAVTELQGKYLIAVVGPDNKADIRPVSVGERIGTDWIISQGLKPGEQVIAEGTQKIRPGVTVNPKPYVPAAPAAPAAASATPPASPAKADDKPATPAPASKG